LKGEKNVFGRWGYNHRDYWFFDSSNYGIVRNSIVIISNKQKRTEWPAFFYVFLFFEENNQKKNKNGYNCAGNVKIYKDAINIAHKN